MHGVTWNIINGMCAGGRGSEAAVQAEALAAVAAVVAGLGEADRAAPAVQADALRGALRAARDSTDAAMRIATAGARDGNVPSISLVEQSSSVLGVTCMPQHASRLCDEPVRASHEKIRAAQYSAAWDSLATSCVANAELRRTRVTYVFTYDGLHRHALCLLFRRSASRGGGRRRCALGVGRRRL